MLNQLLHWVAENDLRDLFYQHSGTVAQIVGALVCLLWYRRKLKLGFLKAAVMLVLWFYGLNYSMTAILWIDSGFRDAGGANIASGYMLLPVVVLLIAKLFREPIDKVSDFLALPPMILYGIGRLGCLFYGCCYGYRCDWGVYNPIQQDYRFPVVLLESALALVLIVVILLVSKKHNYEPTGDLLPMLMTLYGVARVLIEYGHDNIKGPLGLSKYAIHAIITCSVGVVLWQKKRRQKRTYVLVDTVVTASS